MAVKCHEPYNTDFEMRVIVMIISGYGSSDRSVAQFFMDDVILGSYNMTDYSFTFRTAICNVTPTSNERSNDVKNFIEELLRGLHTTTRVISNIVGDYGT